MSIFRSRTTQGIVFCLLGLLLFTAGWFFGSNNVRRGLETASLNKNPPNGERPSPISNRGGSQNFEESVVQEYGYDNSLIDFSLSNNQLLSIAKEIENENERKIYLRKLVNHWIANDPEISDEEREKLLAGISPNPHAEEESFGFVAEMSHYVAKLSDASIRDSWKSNYSDHPTRSQIFSIFLFQDLQNNSPHTLFEASSHWNSWERNRYHDDVMRGWASNVPNEAFAWYQSHPSDFGPDAQQSILDNWARQDFEGLSAHLNSLETPDKKKMAVEGLAKHMVSDTLAAVDWANSLSDSFLQDFAHRIIYRETPRGIGALMVKENGFWKVSDPLLPNGLNTGDLVVSAANDGQEEVNLFGADGTLLLDTLHGEPGSNVTVQIMRQDPETGEYRQMEITITRQQIWFEGKEDP